MLPLETINEVVRLTFEEMAFLDVAVGRAPGAKEAPEEGPILYLEYSRPKNGAVALFLPKEIKFQVAEAVYGEDWAALSPVQLDDSLLELLNVLVGRLLTKRFGMETPYTMGLPTVRYESPGDMAGYDRWDFFFHYDFWELTLTWYEVVP